ncbi:MAG TPA: cytochrome o ubiquinol oxidase subunit IV [Candidatus Saccharimonadales bacterium]|nr:cytochrome o ubiquinol oxidase subunit IV [Candidatus Saccharimonadales bacterium]
MRGIYAYITGLVLSVALTLAAYYVVVKEKFSAMTLLILVGILAVIQFIVQLVFFLHLGRESKPRWNLTMFFFAILVVVIVVFGSLWIMVNLDYHHEALSPSEAAEYLLEDEGIKQ